MGRLCLHLRFLELTFYHFPFDAQAVLKIQVNVLPGKMFRQTDEDLFEVVQVSLIDRVSHKLCSGTSSLLDSREQKVSLQRREGLAKPLIIISFCTDWEDIRVVIGYNINFLSVLFANHFQAVILEVF